jgi:D-alanyl-D-alanine carboxypeptidase/D-alanyl-D-alanine-endopeptidase (penicillin-binding protein 4)
MNPASVMKLVTARVALERLGPAFTWKTRVFAHGEIRGGVLNGSLHITGGGDPRLSRERLWLLLRELRAQGIRRIAGDVVTDRSLFRLAPRPGRLRPAPAAPYNVGADALTVDYGAIRLRVEPTADGASVRSDPLPAGLVIESRIRRSEAGACGDPPASSARAPRGPAA